MIKNKVLKIKVIFETYLKTYKTSQEHFKFSNSFHSTKHQKTVFKNYFLEVFLKILPKDTRTK